MAEANRRRVPKLGVALVVLAIVGGLLWWRVYGSKPDVPENVVALSGRIEGDEASVSAKLSGRIREIAVREGDQVQAGQVIAILDDDQIRARELQAEAAVSAADARVRTARQQIAVLGEQLQQSRISVGQARADAEGRVREAEASLASAEAQLVQAEANYRLAAYDRDAYTKLARTGAVSERQGQQAQASADAQEAIVASAKKRVDGARGALEAARALLANPEVRTAQVSAVEQQIAQARNDVAASEAEAARARALLQEARANRSDLRVLAPFAGTVATRSAEPGEFAAPGATLITLVDLSRVYLRGYVPEGQIGRVRLNQPARVFLDSAPNQPLTAEVTRVDPQAAFTPENTYFREDRVKQVVGVKLQLKDGVGYAKPGMPADGQILVEGAQWPTAKR